MKFLNHFVFAAAVLILIVSWAGISYFNRPVDSDWRRNRHCHNEFSNRRIYESSKYYVFAEILDVQTVNWRWGTKYKLKAKASWKAEPESRDLIVWGPHPWDACYVRGLESAKYGQFGISEQDGTLYFACCNGVPVYSPGGEIPDYMKHFDQYGKRFEYE